MRGPFSYVPYLDIVTLKSGNHSLQSRRCVTETLLKELLQGLVVCFQVDDIALKNILVKLLAKEHHG